VEGLHPQLREMAAAGGAVPTDSSGLEAQRAAYAQTAIELGGAAEEVARVADVVVPRVDGGRLAARAYWPRVPAERTGAIVWLHGGGWCVGDLPGFDRVARQLANASGAVCVSVDYRLAPEHPFPAAADDARAAVAWATGAGADQLGHDPARVLVGGDSAGGNIAAVAARHHRDRLLAQLLVYPAVDARMAGASYRERDLPLLPAEAMAYCWRSYLDGTDPDDPDASPLRATDLAGVPPAFVAVAEHDVLRDDGLAYARALSEAGVAVRVERYDDMAHGFVRWGGLVDRARDLIEALAGFAREAVAR
jgi:acetyl esterase/lipase